MPQDYKSHPSELNGLKRGCSQAKTDVKALREAIPSHCFKSEYSQSLYYIFRDIFSAGTLAYVACHFIPLLDNLPLRWLAWLIYGYVEGLLFTGIWVIGHDCGHGAQFPVRFLNDAFGFLLHSALLTPYFSWKFTHRRHHTHTNHITRDLHYVPPRRKEYIESLWKQVEDVDELTEDAPFVTLIRLAVQQTVGWPLYLMFNITAAATSIPGEPSRILFGNSHFAPFGSLFTRDDALYVILSDLGIAGTLLTLWLASMKLSDGPVLVLLGYLQPYLWLNHWIVAITYLNHTDPQVPKYEHDAWTFAKGATATIDRSLGWTGRYILHGVADYHVVHHLFSTIPFYHLEEATRAIVPLLGDSYHSRKGESFLHCLWEAFTKCQYVEPSNDKEAGTLWYRAGPAPGPEYTMGKKMWTRVAK